MPRIRLKPFPKTKPGPIRRYADGWGWFDFLPVGEEIWRGDYPTRHAARIARRTTHGHSNK